MTEKENEQMLEFLQLAAGWYSNNQNTDAHPWGGMRGSADLGRYLYEYSPMMGTARGNGVWGQGVAIMGLLPLAKRHWKFEHLRESALAASRYLMSLQILDQRDERIFGALRERDPQADWIYPRDGATGGMALCALYRETGDEEYLYRARIFGDWFIRNALSPEGWPCMTYRFSAREAEHKPHEIWQAGAGLFFYYLYQLTGDTRYRDEGLKPIMEGYKQLCADPTKLEAPGQDDFAAITALGACRLYRDDKLLACVRRRMRATLRHQDADGSSPGLDGDGVNALTRLNWIRFVEERKLKEDVTPYRRAIDKAVAFVPSLQERDPRDLRAYGGLYGQTSYGVSRASIHHRATGYCLIFLLNVEGGVEVPGFNIFGWEKPASEIDAPPPTKPLPPVTRRKTSVKGK